MAIIYGHPTGSDASGAGTIANPYATIAKCIQEAMVGDIVDGQSQVYSEEVDVNKSIATIRNCFVDGLWDGSFPVPSTGVLPGGDRYSGDASPIYRPLFKVSADNVIVENCKAYNSSGRGFQTYNNSGIVSNVTYLNCQSYNCYNMSWQAQDFNNLTIDGATSYNNGLQGDDPNSPVSGIPVNIQNIDGTNLTIKNCLIYKNWGEQLGVQQGVDGFELADNLIYDGRRMLIYLMWCKNGHVHRNILIGTDEEPFNKRVEGINLAWEHDFADGTRGNYDETGFSRMDTIIENNLIVGCQWNFNVAYNGTGNIHGAKGVIFRYNTLVNSRPDPSTSNNDCVRIVASGEHEDNECYGNIFHQDSGSISEINGVSGWDFSKGNYWSSSPDASAQSANDIIGSGTFADINATVTNYAAFDKDNYIPNAGSNVLDFGATPAPSVDLYNNSRSTADAGAIERGGTSSTPTPDFSANPTSGQTPLSVTFTDASTGPITTHLWQKKLEPSGSWMDFDGSPAAASPVESFTTGTWSIRQTLNGTETETKPSYITVTDPPPAVGGGELVTDVIQVASPTAAGTQTYNFNLSGKTPKAWVVELTRATTLKTSANTVAAAERNHALLSLGFGDAAGSEACGAIFFRDGTTPPEVSRRWVNDAVALLTNKDGDKLAVAEFSSVAANQLTLNWTGSPTGELIKITVFSGDDYAAQVGTISLGNQDVLSTISTPSIQPNVVQLASVWHTEDVADTNWSSMTIGQMVANSGGIHQACTERAQEGGTTSAKTEMRGRYHATRVLYKRSLLDSGQPSVEGNIGTNEFTLTPRDANLNKDVFYIAHQFPGSVWGGVIDTPTDSSTPTDVTTPGHQPNIIMGQLTMYDDESSTFDDRGGAFGLFTHQDGTTYTSFINSDDNANPTNEGSILADYLLLADDVSGELFDTQISVLANGFRLTSSVLDASARKWLVFTAEQQISTGGSYDLGYWPYGAHPHGYYQARWWPKVGTATAPGDPFDTAYPGGRGRLSVQILENRTGPVIEDITHRIDPDSFEFSTFKHGFESCAFFIPTDPIDGVALYEKIPGKWVRVRSAYSIVWEGRIEDREYNNDGLIITAYGPWRALSDAPYTAFWESGAYADWINAETNQNTDAWGPIFFEYQNKSHVYFSPKPDRNFNNTIKAIAYLAVPDLSNKLITSISFDYTVKGESGNSWVVKTGRYAKGIGQQITFTAYEDTISLTGSQATGSKNLSFTGCEIVTLELYMDEASSTAFTGEPDEVYMAIENIKVNGQPQADDIIKDMVSFINGLNNGQLSSDTNLIEATGIDLSGLVYEDADMPTVIAEFADRGNSSEVIFEAGVWEDARLHFRPKGSNGRTFYIDAGSIAMGDILNNMQNSTYALWKDLNNETRRTAVVNDDESQNQFGIKRRFALKTDSQTLIEAEQFRDTALIDSKKPRPRSKVAIGHGLFDATGGSYPIWEIRSGDQIVLRNLQPSFSVDIERVRKFTVARTQYSNDQIEITPSEPMPELEFLILKNK